MFREFLDSNFTSHKKAEGTCCNVKNIEDVLCKFCVSILASNFNKIKVNEQVIHKKHLAFFVRYTL
ncbi:hypothetical protein TSUD_226440 [Trifolium subterraneum]|uniref:Uncharacterized protein n=1 Tax=Trifolium subterraneum TaxID=3900 RepID=A0A2Z6N801_TRISU|nr:hypothetical protein TSUD_226440 [Trifolium subterraneum]